MKFVGEARAKVKPCAPCQRQLRASSVFLLLTRARFKTAPLPLPVPLTSPPCLFPVQPNGTPHRHHSHGSHQRHSLALRAITRQAARRWSIPLPASSGKWPDKRRVRYEEEVMRWAGLWVDFGSREKDGGGDEVGRREGRGKETDLQTVGQTEPRQKRSR
jgi:hypothetical protein